MILNERMTLLYCFVTALAEGSEGAAFLVRRSGHSGCAGRRGSAAGARRAHHARTNTDLPSGRRPCMRRTLRLGGQRFAKPATASRPSRRSLERDASTRKRSSSLKAKVRPYLADVSARFVVGEDRAEALFDFMAAFSRAL